MRQFHLSDSVVLNHDVIRFGLHKGDRGLVVSVIHDPDGVYVVRFRKDREPVVLTSDELEDD